VSDKTGAGVRRLVEQVSGLKRNGRRKLGSGRVPTRIEGGAGDRNQPLRRFYVPRTAEIRFERLRNGVQKRDVQSSNAVPGCSSLLPRKPVVPQLQSSHKSKRQNSLERQTCPLPEDLGLHHATGQNTTAQPLCNRTKRAAAPARAFTRSLLPSS